MSIDIAVDHIIALRHEVIGETILFIDSYGSIENANLYFDNRLSSAVWKKSSLDSKKLALIGATRVIDNLNFVGDKTDSEQLHAFPRTVNSKNILTPKNIEIATYELAITLLEGVNVNYERDNLSVQARDYQVRTTYNRTFAQEHQSAGINSFIAWTYLKPYLKAPGIINFCRV